MTWCTVNFSEQGNLWMGVCSHTWSRQVLLELGGTGCIDSYWRSFCTLHTQNLTLGRKTKRSMLHSHALLQVGWGGSPEIPIPVSIPRQRLPRLSLFGFATKQWLGGTDLMVHSWTRRWPIACGLTVKFSAWWTSVTFYFAQMRDKKCLTVGWHTYNCTRTWILKVLLPGAHMTPIVLAGGFWQSTITSNICWVIQRPHWSTQDFILFCAVKVS